ncbi:hypothetical protein SALBM311S_05895 [Streptomyces alboniger]
MPPPNSQVAHGKRSAGTGSAPRTVVGRRSAPMPSSSRSWVKKKCLRQVSGQPPSASVQNASG